MVLTDRQAADMRASRAVNDVSAKMTLALRANVGQLTHPEGLRVRNALAIAERELPARLIEIYAQLDDAGETRDELIEVIRQRVSALIQSTIAGLRGSDAAVAFREGARCIAACSLGIAGDFDLAVHEHRKKGPQSSSAQQSIAHRDEERYETVLTIIENMSLVFERNPSTFKSLDEETIRTHFLVQLNGHFGGAATAETSNAGGRTDILIRVEGKNVCIAECKFWNGPKALTAAIDQLFSYTSLRDTRTALIVFNRGTQTSTIVKQIPGLLEKHPRFKCAVPQQGEARFRAIFAQPSDANRELWLTVLVFDVPT